MIRSLLARRTTGRWRARRTIAATTAFALLLPAGLLTVVTAPSASAATLVVEAIAGGGTVIGTECVNSKVVELADGESVSVPEATDPPLKLYVRSPGKTRLLKDESPKWVVSQGSNPKVQFRNSDGNPISPAHEYLSLESNETLGVFGKSDGSGQQVPDTAASMWFVNNFNDPQPLGTVVHATFEYNYGDGFYPCDSGDPPPQPVIKEVIVGKHNGTVTLAPDAVYGIFSYKLRLKKKGTGISIPVPDENDTGKKITKVERSSEGTVVSFEAPVPESVQGESGIISNFDGNPWTVEVIATNGSGLSSWSDPEEFTPIDPSDSEALMPKVERVLHFAEGKNDNPRVQSNVKLDKCKTPEGCVVGYGYNDKDEGDNWDNTFELWFKEGVPGRDIAVSVGGIEVETRDSDGNSKCSKDNEQGIVKKCFRLTEAHEKLKDEGEQPIRVGATTIAEWDFFGKLSSGWDDPPDGNWDGYHIFLVQEGLWRDGQLNLDDSAFTDFCSAKGWALLPHKKDLLTTDVCFQQGVEVRAKFDWDNSADTWDQSKDLYWLEAVIQFGSNKLAHGDNAFRNMSARGGAAFERLDVSDLGSMEGMFRGAEFFDANLKEEWNVSSLGVGAPAAFDDGTAAWETDREDKDYRDGTGKGRPDWNTGQVVVSASEVRAERTSDRGLSIPALNAFSIETVEQTGVASSAEQNFNLGYEVGGVGGDSREVLEDDASTPLSVGVGEEPRNGRVEVAKGDFPVEVTVTASDADLIAEGTFEVFAPCKTESQDVAVTVKQVSSRIRGGVAVEVELHAGLGVLPPGNVTVRASDGSQTALSVPGGQPSGSVVAEWEWRASGDPQSGTTDDAESLVFGHAFADFTWSPADTGDNGPECASQRLVVSRANVTALEVNFESAEIDKCEVGAGLLELLNDLQAPETPHQTTLTARSSALTEPAADSDADGVPDALDQDLDGDGVQNQVDPDIDGDGTPNGADKDIDGDGLSNKADDFPKGPPPVARPMPIGITDAERDALLEQLYGEQVPVTFPVPDGDYAEGAGQIVVGPDPEIMVEVAIMNLNDQENFSKLCPDLQLPVLPMPGLPGPETGNELPDLDGTVFPILPDGGGKPGSESGSGAGDGSGSGPGGGAGNLRVALAVPSEAFKGVPTELEAEVYPASTDGYVEFAVQEIDLTGQQSVRILGSAPVEQEQVTVDGQTVTVARASLDLVPADYGDAIVYARVTEKGSGAQDTTARAAVVNPAPFADNFSLTVGGDAWLPVETGNVLGYGYSPVEFTTMTGEAPRITTPVDGPCQVLSTRSIPPQIRMLGTAIAPKRCSFTVTTPGGGAYAPVSYTYDVALSMGTQTATLAADKAKMTIKKGSMVTVAKKTQTKTDEDYKLKGKKITWSVTSGKDVCAVKTSSSGKVSVKGKKKGTCTVRAKAPKVKRKYKSFTEFYDFRVK